MSTNTTAKTHAAGYLQHVIMKAESSLETISSGLASSTRVLLEQFNIGRTREDFLSPYKRTTLDTLSDAWIEGKQGASFSLTTAVRPSGSAGTAPDVGLLLKAAGLTETVTGATKVEYTPGNAIGNTLHIAEDLETYQQLLQGGIVQNVTLNLPTNNEPAKFDFEGIGTRVLRNGYSTLTGTLSGTETAIPVAELGHFEVGGFIQINGDNNSGAGYEITAKASATGAGNLTIGTAFAGTGSSGDAVMPYTPSPSATGDILPMISGSSQIDSNAVKVVGGTLSIQNEISTDLDAMAQDRWSDFRITGRTIELSLDLYLRRDDLMALKPVGVNTLDVALVMGDTAGKKLTVDVDYWAPTFPELDVPEKEFVMVKLTGPCLGSSGDDSIKLNFN